MVLYPVTFEDFTRATSYMRHKISICTAGIGYAIDQTIYLLTVVKLASKLVLQRLHDMRMCMVYIFATHFFLL